MRTREEASIAKDQEQADKMKAQMKKINDAMFKCQQMLAKTDDPAKQEDLRAKVAKFDSQLETLEEKEKKQT